MSLFRNISTVFGLICAIGLISIQPTALADEQRTHRVLENPVQDGNFILRINDGGAKTDALTIRGNDASVAIRGTATNDNACTGCVGEVIAATLSATTQTTVGDTEVDITGASIALTPGHWQIHYSGTVHIYNNGADGTSQYARVRMTDSANTLVTGSTVLVGNDKPLTLSNDYLSVERTFPLKISATTTYKLRLTGTRSAALGTARFVGAPDIGVFTGTDSEAVFHATRVR